MLRIYSRGSSSIPSSVQNRVEDLEAFFQFTCVPEND